jgi:hypothetical protein
MEYLHIVCLDAPSPANYGGAIDMFYKMKALAESGKKIILHYFAYRSGRDANGLEPYCVEIRSYDRHSFFNSFNFTVPYIVRSRINSALIKRLNKDQHPILLEGVHTSGLIAHLDEPYRVAVRMHNEEAEYYRMLARAEKNIAMRLYLNQESQQIKKYYRHLRTDISLACISLSDEASFRKNYGFTNTHFIPAFVPWDKIISKEGKGLYFLYHGNMAIAENEAAAYWLIENVFSKITVPFVIAGNAIPARLVRAARKYAHIQIVNNPSMEEISSLIQEAHANVLPSMNNTGVKLKLLHAAFEGRFCLSNTSGLKGSSIENAIIQCNEANEYIQNIEALMTRSFTDEDKKNRQQLLAVYDNAENAKRLNALWTHYR